MVFSRRVFRVTNGRFHFKCPYCKTRKMVSVSASIRQRSIQCFSCKETTRCILNRRTANREQQLGRVTLVTHRGERLDAKLFDISPYGVGFDISIRDKSKLHVGDEVKFICPWKPNLLQRGAYKLRSLKACRAGAEQMKKLIF